MLRSDPFSDPEPLIRQVYAYVAYRIGAGPDAEDITSDTIERALRYRKSYHPSKGTPSAWLVGIARRCLQDAATRTTVLVREPPDLPSSEDLAEDAIQRLTLQAAVSQLDERDRELIGMRHGGDLKAREIGELLGMQTHAVEVALVRARERLARELRRHQPGEGASEAP
jgi:RNA polymerase sigma factor (sigma-70 family)